MAVMEKVHVVPNASLLAMVVAKEALWNGRVLARSESRDTGKLVVIENIEVLGYRLRGYMTAYKGTEGFEEYVRGGFILTLRRDAEGEVIQSVLGFPRRADLNRLAREWQK